MSSSLFLTNWLFCGCSALILIFLLNDPKILIHKGKIWTFAILSAIAVKLFIPFEFSFTQTLKSTTILTFTRKYEKLLLFHTISIKTFLIIIWIGVAVAMFFYAEYQYFRIKKIISRIHPTTDNSILNLINTLCKQEKIKKIPNVIQLDTTVSPFVFGVLNPTVILPYDIQKEELEHVLMHELQHIKQGHLYLKLIINIIVILHWWFPIAWLLNNKISQALEHQADHCAIQKLTRLKQISYLKTLFHVAKSTLHHQSILTPLSFASDTQILKNRISALSDSIEKKDRKQLTLLQKLNILIAFSLLIFPVFYTFEAYSKPSPEELDGAISINKGNSFFIVNEIGTYDFYHENNHIHTFGSIPNAFKELEIKQNITD